MIVEILSITPCALGYRLSYYRPDTATNGAVILPAADQGVPALRRGMWAMLERTTHGVRVTTLEDHPRRGRGWSWRMRRN